MGTRRRAPVAIAHDYLTQRGGAERVVLAMSRAFPDAPIYTTLYDREGTYPEFADREIVVSPLNRVTTLRRHHHLALPLLPAVSSGVSIDADVVIASSSGWAHGFRTDGAKVVYCHNPARWLYQTNDYLAPGVLGGLARLAVAVLGPGLRSWDHRAASTAERYLANSTVVRRRIRTTYGIDAAVLHPPPGLDPTGPQEPLPGVEDWREEGFHLVVSRLMPYKHVDVAVDLVNRDPSLGRLVVIGRGPCFERLSAKAGERVSLHQDVSDAQLRWAYAHARFLIAASYEDFGLTPIEAGLFRVPVVALRSGGYLDTVVEGVTGLFFDEPTVDAVGRTLHAALEHPWDRARIQEQARSCGEEGFAHRLRQIVEDVGS